MKRRLVRTLTHLEWLFDTLVGRMRPPRAAPPVVDPYLGYSTPEHWVARGRVLTRLVRPEVRAGQRRGRNLLQMLSLFLTNEVAEVTVIAPAHGVSAVTDEEGYFTLLVPRGPSQGWAGASQVEPTKPGALWAASEPHVGLQDTSERVPEQTAGASADCLDAQRSEVPNIDTLGWC